MLLSPESPCVTMVHTLQTGRPPTECLERRRRRSKRFTKRMLVGAVLFCSANRLVSINSFGWPAGSVARVNCPPFILNSAHPADTGETRTTLKPAGTDKLSANPADCSMRLVRPRTVSSIFNYSGGKTEKQRSARLMPYNISTCILSLFAKKTC